MRRLFFGLSVLLLVVPLVLGMACSGDDDTPGATTAITQQATTSTTEQQAGTTTESAPKPVVRGKVMVDFTGAPEELEAIDAEFEVEAGTTAWDAIRAALGEENLSYQDFGGDLGIFITGFKGVEVEGNHFWEFKVNGETAEAGVSKYKVQDGDVLEFAYSSF